MKKKWPPRPVKNYRMVSLQSIVEIEASHRRAGFPEIKDEVIQRRFWQMLRFLACKAYLVSECQNAVLDVGLNTELMNFDLTDEGYLFVQRVLDKWHGRLYKDKGSEAEWRFLEKWHSQFLAERLSA